MIKLQKGDILKADAEALVNTVNCVGAMGRGIALQFRKEYPENYDEYKTICERKELHPGKMLIHDLHRLMNPRYIINFPTKQHWKGKSRLEDIDAGLDALIKDVRRLGIRSIAIPPVGCGLGGLNWSDVRPRVERAFRNLPDVQVLLYEPAGAPEAAKMAREKKIPQLTKGRAALIGLMGRYLIAVMDPFISLLEIHKLMYFMQESGENLQLRYQKGLYGPYAENLRHVLSLIEGHFIRGYGDGADRPDTQIELQSEVSDQVEIFMGDHPTTHVRFNRVVDLIRGFETSFGMELLATVHWVSRHEGATTADEAIAKTYAWSDRKRMFQETHIRVAWDALYNKGWLT
ncbi:MAG: macro domain-containing protein [Deltaproteobacteria bacterium]|nr:macro domain-containing protein [Deltaproteobacteria bacterium]